MKLTNTIRDAFVRAAMQDVPSTDFTEQIRAAVMADAVDQLPPKVRTIYKDKALSQYVRTDWVANRLPQSVSVPCSRDQKFKLSEKAAALVADLQARKNAQDEQHTALRDRLKAVAYSVSTRKALAEALPEFEKYLPADEAAALRTVPVIANVVAEFVKAGWPKGAKQKAAA